MYNANNSGDCVKMHPNTFQTLPLLPSKRPALPAWGAIPPRPAGMSHLRPVLMIVLNSMTSIPPVQRAVIDLTKSRSPTPDNRPAPNESGGPLNSNTQLTSVSQTQQEMDGGQDNPMNRNLPSPRSANANSIAVRTSPPHQITSSTSGDPSVSPKTAISEPPLGPGSPKEEPFVKKDNRHDVNRLLV